MKTTVENLDPSRIKLTVEVPYEELKPSLDAAYKEIGSQIQVPGFRRGHVPNRVIDQRVGRGTVIQEAVNNKLSDFYRDAITEAERVPMLQPEVDVVELPNATGENGGQLAFTAEVTVRPVIELPDLSKAKLTVDAVEVTDEDVEKELEDLRGRFATLKTINRKAKTGDFATIDLVATINGEQVDSASDVSYEIGSGTMLDGQDTALRGTKAGDEVTFTSTLKGGDHEGEEAEVTITVKAMKVRELPKADDDFAQMVSEFDTIDELKEDLKKQAGESKESQQALAARDALIDVLLGKVEIVLPESAVDQQVEHRVGEDAKPKEKKEAREAVEKEIRTELLSEALAKKFDVQVSQQELIDYAIQMSQNFGIDINQLFSSSQQMANVVADLGRSKALIEALKVVTVKDTNGADVDLSKFFGTDPATEEGAEIITEVADEQE